LFIEPKLKRLGIKFIGNAVKIHSLDNRIKFIRKNPVNDRNTICRWYYFPFQKRMNMIKRISCITIAFYKKCIRYHTQCIDANCICNNRDLLLPEIRKSFMILCGNLGKGLQDSKQKGSDN